MSRRKRTRPDKRSFAYDMARTGWPPGMLQDDSREFSQWLTTRPEAMLHAREAVDAIKRSVRPDQEES